jgi:hypothetical protein
MTVDQRPISKNSEMFLIKLFYLSWAPTAGAKYSSIMLEKAAILFGKT